jgi:hypothetical protein
MKVADGKMLKSITQRRCMMPVSSGGIEIGMLIIRTWTSSKPTSVVLQRHLDGNVDFFAVGAWGGEV